MECFWCGWEGEVVVVVALVDGVKVCRHCLEGESGASSSVMLLT